MELSIAQNEALNFIYGQVIVIACPGSGKTTTIINRTVRMVEEKNVNPASMLNITFTKAAADEMATRFHKKSNKKVSFSTIHAFCYHVLCTDYGYTKDDILKESEKWIFISELLRNTIAPAQMEDVIKEVMQGISFCKNKQLPTVAYKCEKCNQKVFDNIYKSYIDYTAKIKKIDFDDMLILFRDKLLSNPDFLKKMQNQYKFITVDEFQDVNQIQADICYLIAGDKGNIFIVGDDDQSIYRFRGAESQIMLDFPKHYPNCKKIFLDTNYRSCNDIVRAADNLIRNNKIRFDKSFIANRTENGELYVLDNNNSVEQAKKIVEEIKYLHQDDELYEDMAILYRNNNLSLSLINALVQNKIPFHVTEKVTSIHQDPIMMDIKSYYNLATGNEKKGDLLRIINRPSRFVPIRKIMNVTYDKEDILKALTGEKPYVRTKVTDMCWDIKALGEKKKPSLFINYLVTCMGYKDFLKKGAEYLGKDVSESYDTLDLLTQEAKKFKTMPEWFSYIEGYENGLKKAAEKKNKEGICLSTFHSSKGLEWKDVFVVNVNEKVTPYIKAETPEDIEEERRMFYVACTRAKDRLYLSYLVTNDGKQIPSRFLSEMKVLGNFSCDEGDNMQLDLQNGLGVAAN